MKRLFGYHGEFFYIGNYTPRHNEYEKGLKYQLYIKCPDYIAEHTDYIATDYKFCTIKEAKQFVKDNIYMFL